MHFAAEGGNIEVLRLLLTEFGADAHAKDNRGWTPLHSAVHNGDPRSVELLLAHGADATAVDDEGRSVAEMAEESHEAATIAAIAAALA